MSGSVQLEADPAGQERHDELVQRDALLRCLEAELRVQRGGHADEDTAIGGHVADDSAYAIDRSDSACDIRSMSNVTFTVRMKITVNEAAWNHEYGTPVASVEDYILNQISQSPAADADAITVTGFAVET